MPAVQQFIIEDAGMILAPKALHLLWFQLFYFLNLAAEPSNTSLTPGDRASLQCSPWLSSWCLDGNYRCKVPSLLGMPWCRPCNTAMNNPLVSLWSTKKAQIIKAFLSSAPCTGTYGFHCTSYITGCLDSKSQALYASAWLKLCLSTLCSSYLRDYKLYRLHARNTCEDVITVNFVLD